MAIIKFPDHLAKPESLPCILCSLSIPPAKATIGMLDAHNQQTFACNAHFWDKHWFMVNGWIAFATQECMKLLAMRQRQQAVNTYGWKGTSNEWSLH